VQEQQRGVISRYLSRSRSEVSSHRYAGPRSRERCHLTVMPVLGAGEETLTGVDASRSRRGDVNRR